MTGLLDRISNGDTLLSDGAMGTMLMQHGLGPGECPEEFSLTRPGVLKELARLYAGAGADIVETNTFGGSPLKLRHFNLDGRTREINALAVQAAREGVGDEVLIAGSVGPIGVLLKPLGPAEPDEVLDGFQTQVAALVDAGADCIFVETMFDIAEARLAVKAAKNIAPDTPVSATMTFNASPRGLHTSMGVDIQAASAQLEEAGADIVGSNCGNGIENMVRIARAFARHSDLPILIQSNAGLPDIVEGRLAYAESPEFMAGHVPEMLAAKVSIIGGCCGTTPAHIRALRRVLDGR